MPCARARGGWQRPCSLFEDLQAEQTELERRLLSNRLKWIMPFFYQLKATELLQYTQVHQLEWMYIEDIQKQEHKRAEEMQSNIVELDLKSFDKQMQSTIRERRKMKRPLSREEIDIERENFEYQQVRGPSRCRRERALLGGFRSVRLGARSLGCPHDPPA